MSTDPAAPTAPLAREAPGDPAAPWFAPFVHAGLADARPYDASHHDYAWRHRELHRMMSNECPLPPPPAVMQAAIAALREGNLYPNSAWELRDALASVNGVAPGSIILGNGSTEVLDVLIRAMFSAGEEAVIHVPTYAFFETQVRLHGGTPVLVPIRADHSFDPDALLAAITPRTRAIFICSPNNPTGNSWTVAELARVLAAGLPVIVDQAYVECGYSTSFSPLVERHPNLIVTRTMSKAYGLAALRVGYLVADPALVDLLLRLRIPFSISLIAARACLAAVVDPSILEERRSYISSERDRVLEGLRRLPRVTPFDSDGNFILIDVGRTGRTSTEIVEYAKREGLLLLRAVTAHGLGSGHLRVTIGTHEENDLFLATFARAIGAGETDAAVIPG
jgi:histidinol-phosphate aminotransferase